VVETAEVAVFNGLLNETVETVPPKLEFVITALKRGVNKSGLPWTASFRWLLKLWLPAANLSIGSVRADVVAKPTVGRITLLRHL
jgi:hypothetical protein